MQFTNVVIERQIVHFHATLRPRDIEMIQIHVMLQIRANGTFQDEFGNALLQNRR